MTLQPVTLGCVQATAERLSRASGGRPALVVKEEYGRGRPMYALNELGYEVKNHLVAQLLERLKYV